jgi:hypothetical protein
LKHDSQVVGNAGLYYTCYRLSKLGWNVLPTSRNAKGIDIVAYNQDASHTITIQVKSLSRRNPVPLGNKLDYLLADFIVICRNVLADSPECFVLNSGEVKNSAHCGKKDGKTSYWLQPCEYEQERFRENWARIGFGDSSEDLSHTG